MRFFDMGVEADEDGCQTDEGMECGHELRHFRHLHAACHEVAENRPACQHHQHDEPVADIRSENRSDDRERHSGDAVPDGAFGAFLAGETAERKDEKNRRGNVGRRNNTKCHDYPLTRLKTSGTWQACAVSRGSHPRY